MPAVAGENPLVSDPNLNHAEKCLKNMDFLIVQDIFLTETAAMAQWMIGETFFHQNNYDEALRAYSRVEILGMVLCEPVEILAA